MNGKFSYTASMILGALSLVLVLSDIAMINSNRHLQDQVNQRQAQINQGAQLSNLNQGLVQALADIVVKENDSSIRTLLKSQGITIKQNETAGKPASDKK